MIAPQKKEKKVVQFDEFTVKLDEEREKKRNRKRLDCNNKKYGYLAAEAMHNILIQEEPPPFWNAWYTESDVVKTKCNSLLFLQQVVDQQQQNLEQLSSNSGMGAAEGLSEFEHLRKNFREAYPTFDRVNPMIADILGELYISFDQEGALDLDDNGQEWVCHAPAVMHYCYGCSSLHPSKESSS